jgi:glycosyltransferase involved in cell wall biosynthesis
MHVAFWSPAWPLEKHHNGIVTYVHWMRRELEGQGHRVSVFSGLVDVEVKDPNVHFVQRDRWGSLVRRLAGRLYPHNRDIFRWGEVIGAAVRRVHQHDPIDIFEMEESFGWAADVGRITSIPTLMKLHGPAFLSLVDEELTSPIGVERIEREGRALAAAAAIASPCGVTLTQTLERYRLTPPIAAHIVNPVTMNADAPLWNLAACDRNTILFVGRFDKRKGADLVMQAFATLLQTRPELKLVIVGPDAGLLQPDGSRIHFQAYRDAVLPEALSQRVEFKGRMANREVAALRCQAMVTVVASRWENQGYAALEAMLQGCPVVCSDAGGCPEIIAHGQTGLLARSGDAADFAHQLATVLADPTAAAAMGSAARAYVLAQHSPARVAAESIALFDRVIGTPR